jgi:replicative DNA helicase
LSLIIIDQLRYIKAEGKGPTEQRSNAFFDLCGVAKDLKLPILLLHQLNRETTKNTGAMPQLQDLKQTGETEDSARSVWLLHRPYYYDREKDAHELWLIVAKQTNGPTGVLKLYCDLPTMFVSDKKEEEENGY